MYEEIEKRRKEMMERRLEIHLERMLRDKTEKEIDEIKIKIFDKIDNISSKNNLKSKN